MRHAMLDPAATSWARHETLTRALFLRGGAATTAPRRGVRSGR